MISGNYPEQEMRGASSVRLPTRLLLHDLDRGPVHASALLLQLLHPKHRGEKNANEWKAIRLATDPSQHQSAPAKPAELIRHSLQMISLPLSAA